MYSILECFSFKKKQNSYSSKYNSCRNWEYWFSKLVYQTGLPKIAIFFNFTNIFLKKS